MKHSSTLGISGSAQSASLGRRTILQYGGLLGVAAGSPWLLSACGADSGKSAGAAAGKTGGSVVVENSTGAGGDCLRSGWFDPFQSKSGAKVISAVEADDSRIRAAVETGVYSVDVETTNAATLTRFGDKLFEPLDFTQIKRDDFIEGLISDYGISQSAYTYGLGYNTKFTGGKTPTTLEDFFDLDKFPGKRGAQATNDNQALLFAIALMADGVAPEDVFPLDIDRAIKKLDTIKDQLVLYPSGTVGKDNLESGETPLTLTYANRIFESVAAGQPVGMVWDGFLLSSGFYAIPKGDPNKDIAMQFLAYIAGADANGGRAQCNPGYTPANKRSVLTGASKDWVATLHLNERHIVLTSPDIVNWVAQNQAAITQRYQTWLGK